MMKVGHGEVVQQISDSSATVVERACFPEAPTTTDCIRGV